VIVQNNTGNRFSTTTIVAVLTTKDKKSKQGKHYPMQVPMEKTQLDDGELEEDSLLLCEQMFTVDKERLTKKIGRIFPTNPLYQEIDRAIGISLGLESEQ
jgi:mRNA interferase MazF